MSVDDRRSARCGHVAVSANVPGQSVALGRTRYIECIVNHSMPAFHHAGGTREVPTFTTE